MECGLNKWGINKTLLRSMLLIVSIAILLLACDPCYGGYPYQRSSTWVSSDPVFTVVYSELENGVIEQTTMLEVNGMPIEVNLYFQSSLFDVYPKGINSYDNRLFGGKWEYREGDLVLIVEEDYLFDNEYSEIVFSSSDSD